MIVIESATRKKHVAKITPLTTQEYTKITKARFFFDWRTEKENEVFKLQLQGSDEILGLVSLITCEDKRIEINLLAVSKENRGKGKQYERIAGNLIAWACKLAIRQFGEDACVSLIPKTRLIKHYKEEYGMVEAGRSLFLSDIPLIVIIEEFEP